MLARKRGRWARTKEPVHDDLVCRAFGAKAANELWFADITEHPTAEGKLYLCAIKDAFSGRIVGYSMDSHMKASLAVTALHNAIALRGPGRDDRPFRSRESDWVQGVVATLPV